MMAERTRQQLLGELSFDFLLYKFYIRDFQKKFAFKQLLEI